MLYLEDEYVARAGLIEKSGSVGQAPEENVRIVNGVQHVEPATAGLVMSYLANLCPTGPTGPGGEGRACWDARPSWEAEDMEGGCGAGNALEYGRTIPHGATVLINMNPMPTPGLVGVCIVLGGPTSDAVKALASQGMDYAVIDLSKAVTEPKKEEEKKKVEPTTLLLGAGVGGGLGFVVGGPVGAVAGGVGGALIANWMAS